MTTQITLEDMPTESKLVKQSHFITQPGKMNIIESGNRLNFYNDAITMKKSLDSGKVYTLFIDPLFGSLSLEYGEPLQLPQKVYDFEKDFRDQILVTLRSTRANNNIGVLLEGYKGQGKSVVAKQLAIESGLPIVLINRKIPVNSDIIGFLSGIKQDFVLLIDEFEKLFIDEGRYSESAEKDSNYHTQNTFLTLLDGTIGLEHKRLVIFTTNKEIGDKFINRPSRIRYYKKYNVMNNDVFNAILDDKLENPAFKQDLEDQLSPSTCTIDILTTIIEEVNIQNKPYSEFKDIFNHKDPEITYSRYLKVGNEYQYIDELTVEKEIGINPHLGRDCRVLKNENGKTIYYTVTEWVSDPGDPEEDKGEYKKQLYKLVKQEAYNYQTKWAF